MEVWVKITPGKGDDAEVWLVKLSSVGAFTSNFVLRSFSNGDNPMGFAIGLAQWMNIKAVTVFETNDSFVTQVQYDPSREIREP